MDPVTIHLRLNHFPVILVFVAAAAGIVALFVKKEWIWRYALVSVVLAGISAPVAYWTGLRAEDQAEGFENIDAGQMEDHKSSAVPALVALIVGAVAGGVAIAKPTAPFRWTAVGVTVVAAGLTAYTGAHAGHIAHNAFTEGRPDEPAADADTGSGSKGEDHAAKADDGEHDGDPPDDHEK